MVALSPVALYRAERARRDRRTARAIAVARAELDRQLAARLPGWGGNVRRDGTLRTPKRAVGGGR